ncbi:MAG TPA: alpha/beta hydrolase [Dehalococcoidia bacterium]|nr:alpha/beta hydrolase [Dehalococcoidia bacterium]
MSQTEAPAAFAGFNERYLEADGFHIRCLEAGSGPPLVVLHGGGGLAPGRAHALLAERCRLIAFEVPGFGASPVNERSQSMPELAHTMHLAIAALGLGRYALLGSSFGGRLAAWLALEAADEVEALVLVAPAAILREDPQPAAQSPQEIAARLYAHPERQPLPAVDPAVTEKQIALVRRVFGPARAPDLEAGLGALQTPTLVLFGTEDRVTAPDLGRIYQEIMPRCQFVLVYDAGHALAQERPEAFARIVADFIARKAEFVTSAGDSMLSP